jgi:hypothetical protein
VGWFAAGCAERVERGGDDGGAFDVEPAGAADPAVAHRGQLEGSGRLAAGFLAGQDRGIELVGEVGGDVGQDPPAQAVQGFGCEHRCLAEQRGLGVVDDVGGDVGFAGQFGDGGADRFDLLDGDAAGG